ncbi:MAG: polysaccharide deacetylase family protein [Desulfobaccales bacterium]
MDSGILEDLTPVRLVDVADQAYPLRWLIGRDFFWPRLFLQNLIEAPGSSFATIAYQNTRYDLHAPGAAMIKTGKRYKEIREKIIFTPKSLSARLPFSYQKVPYNLRWIIAAYLIKINKIKQRKTSRFPHWPLDLSIDSIIDIERYITQNHHGPSLLSNTAVLTHDIDSPESLENLGYFLEIEEFLGIRSTNFIVPKGWQLDRKILERLVQEGHEIGVHGYNHNNRTPFLPRTQIKDRFDEILSLISEYQIKGYRSPSLLRSKTLFAVLEEYFIYDSSIPNVGGFVYSQGNGCASARPFYYNNLLEIPITLPSDAELLFQGFKPDDILQLWITLSKVILKSGGIINLLTHCERRYSGNQTMLKIYEQYLVFLKSSGVSKWKTLSQVADAFINGA